MSMRRAHPTTVSPSSRVTINRVTQSPSRPSHRQPSHRVTVWSFLIRAIRILAVAVDDQRVVADPEAGLLGHPALPVLDSGVHELHDLAALGANDVVMVSTLVELEYRLAALEMMPNHELSRLELSQHPIHSRQPHILTRFQQGLVDVLRAHVSLLARFENLQDPDARQGCLQARLLEILGLHVLSPVGEIGQAAEVSSDSCSLRMQLQPTMRQLLIIVPLALGAAVSACTGEHIPFVYKIDINQGNILNQDMVDQLEPGMNKARVRYVMGSPMLVDVFHENRWDYIYLRRPGRGKPEKRRITLHFENDQLARIDGDVRIPGGGNDSGRMRRVSNVEIPLYRDQGYIKGFMERIGVGDDKPRDKTEPETQKEKQ